MRINIFWFRRDLRYIDNHALYEALSKDLPVLPLFIFDSNILQHFPDKNDPRLTFIYDQLEKIHTIFKNYNSGIDIRIGKPIEIFAQLLREYSVGSVYVNSDYEPYSRDRDSKIRKMLDREGISFHSFKDHLIFEKNEIMKSDNSPYHVFTPYCKSWLKKLSENEIPSYPSEEKLDNLLRSPFHFPALDQLGYQRQGQIFPSDSITYACLESYKGLRDFPSKEGTSKLGIHLRFGSISIRKLLRQSLHVSDTFVNELVWREFYAMILWHHPHITEHSFKSVYDRIEWLNKESDFKRWKNGQTGFPFVDAGMRQLNQEGFMHNRLRMITASFLTKHLLIDWRWGEEYFRSKLLDFDLASNNGGWQWAAGTGCDAAPYFRIFNPETQMKKFDPDLIYTKKYIPELGSTSYNKPMVDHKNARLRCLETYKKALKP